jgi:uncharacterized protein (TIGR02246 family)
MTDDAAIRELVVTYAAAWGRSDGAGFAGVFAEDADSTTVRGERVHGRPVIAAGHDAILATIYRGTRLAAEVVRIRHLRPDVAVVEIDAQLRRRWRDAVRSAGVPAPRRRSGRRGGGGGWLPASR